MFDDSCFTARTRLNRGVGLHFKPELEKDAIPTVFEHKRRASTDERRAFAERRRKEVRCTLFSSTKGAGLHTYGKMDSFMK